MRAATKVILAGLAILLVCLVWVYLTFSHITLTPPTDGSGHVRPEIQAFITWKLQGPIKFAALAGLVLGLALALGGVYARYLWAATFGRLFKSTD